MCDHVWIQAAWSRFETALSRCDMRELFFCQKCHDTKWVAGRV